MAEVIASDLHDLPVHVATDAAECDRLVDEHILKARHRPDLVGTDCKFTRTTRRAGANRRLCMVQLATDSCCFVLRYVRECPAADCAVARLLQEPGITKIGPVVGSLASWFRAEHGVECRGINELLVRAARLAQRATLKGMPERAQALRTGGARGLWKFALGEELPRPPPTELAWDGELTPQQVDYAGWEAQASLRTARYLSTLDGELGAGRGPFPVTVSNLPADVTAAALDEIFQPTSRRKTEVSVEPRHRSTALAILFYNERGEALQCVEDNWGVAVGGRKVQLTVDNDGMRGADTRQQRERKGRQMYLGPLPPFTTEQRIIEHVCGDSRSRADILEARFYTSQGEGYGSVFFRSARAAAEAVDRAAETPFTYSIRKADGSASTYQRSVLADTDPARLSQLVSRGEANSGYRRDGRPWRDGRKRGTGPRHHDAGFPEAAAVKGGEDRHSRPPQLVPRSKSPAHPPPSADTAGAAAPVAADAGGPPGAQELNEVQKLLSMPPSETAGGKQTWRLADAPDPAPAPQKPAEGTGLNPNVPLFSPQQVPQLGLPAQRIPAGPMAPLNPATLLAAQQLLMQQTLAQQMMMVRQRQLAAAGAVPGMMPMAVPPVMPPVLPTAAMPAAPAVPAVGLPQQGLAPAGAALPMDVLVTGLPSVPRHELISRLSAYGKVGTVHDAPQFATQGSAAVRVVFDTAPAAAAAARQLQGADFKGRKLATRYPCPPVAAAGV
eukprot:TRINITY_DN4022_c0_g1_i3.p1 TRINITY_DN4022_c0_g1~~TRINITY_DN4022_c0_g1_i3.p1  ORF type:complete len:756 (+),score=153.80 TRINITY_DN4022_c0_g1_i3:87-2270(+)